MANNKIADEDNNAPNPYQNIKFAYPEEFKPKNDQNKLLEQDPVKIAVSKAKKKRKISNGTLNEMIKKNRDRSQKRIFRNSFDSKFIDRPFPTPSNKNGKAGLGGKRWQSNPKKRKKSAKRSKRADKSPKMNFHGRLEQNAINSFDYQRKTPAHMAILKQVVAAKRNVAFGSGNVTVPTVSSKKIKKQAKIIL